MNTVFHRNLKERWHVFPLIEQMANIGAEVGRCINWKNKGQAELSKRALYRRLELLDYTAADKKNSNSLKEILRVREALVDFFLGENIYKSSDRIWEKYFFQFNVAARKNRS
ncbi:hypothetical protein C4579_00720 [Candidatus Microgenomates bacterium]|nr:MAG: hypothetical protein C4579_00720 [Candidatus Microgenomates bacterium]